MIETLEALPVAHQIFLIAVIGAFTAFGAVLGGVSTYVNLKR
ncbi:MAG: hypothetical protein Q8L66_06305 [Caulobacter sp.]|nr:hypothetical protein [Caulobacter sp.]